MKHVTKNTSPEDFEAWKAEANQEGRPIYRDLRNPEKRNLLRALLAEQGSVCCYCGRSISLEDSHIEHFRPQDRYETLQLEYANLHASCVRWPEPSTPRHCGHAKGNGFDEDLHITPVDPECEQAVLYTLRGAIVPTAPEDRRAKYMIDLLALDSPILQHLRNEVLTRTLGPEFLATATQEEMTRLRDGFRRRDAAGNLPDFGHVIARYAEQSMVAIAPPPGHDDVAQLADEPEPN